MGTDRVANARAVAEAVADAAVDRLGLTFLVRTRYSADERDGFSALKAFIADALAQHVAEAVAREQAAELTIDRAA